MNCKHCGVALDLLNLRRKNRSARGEYCSGQCYRQRLHAEAVARTATEYAVLPSKVCARCGKEKHSSSFYFRDASHTSLQGYCKVCLNDEQRIRWDKLKARAVELLGGKCSACGLVDDPVVYDFHHRTGEKTMDWTNLMRQSWAKIVEELKACTLICANCHRKHHKHSGVGSTGRPTAFEAA